MKTVGIIAEYNPFHNGHAYQLQEAKKLSGADVAIVVMSTSVVQRGELALVSPHLRAEMALRSGADVVFALPALWAVQDAEHYALAGVHLLKLLQVDAISFGTETSDIAPLQALADLLEDQPPALQTVLHAQLNEGLSYPAALALAAEAVLPGSQDLLAQPNNTLALCYLRAIRRLNVDFEVYPVCRQSPYHMSSLPANGFASATAIRNAINSNQLDQICPFVPKASFDMLSATPIARMDRLDTALLYRLRSMRTQELQHLPGCSEGIESRLQQAAHQAISRAELLSLCKTKRYPFARLSRMCIHALLNITNGDCQTVPLPDQAWLLGFHDQVLPWLRQAKEKQIPIASRADDLSPSRWLDIEQQAWELFCLAANQPVQSILSHRLVRVID